jgi:hypothetical protein
MNFTRRDFLKLSGLASVAWFGFSGSVFAKSQNDVLDDQTADTFRQLIGSEFYIYNDNISTNVTLIEVKDFPSVTKKGECFLLVFKTPLEETEQATYTLFHPTLGNFELMMTKGKIKKNSVLVATINRI